MGRILHLTALLGVGVCCLLMTACADKVEELPTSDATLEGTITYNGKPVPHALVIVAPAGEGSGIQGTADASGKYTVQNAPIGEVRIGVNTEAGRGMMMGKLMAAKKGAPGEKPNFVDVPKKYFEPSTSGITTTIKSGPNTFDIQLK